VWVLYRREPPRLTKKRLGQAHIETDILSWWRRLLASLGMGLLNLKSECPHHGIHLVECFLIIGECPKPALDRRLLHACLTC
jgi:hypothetical protein